MGRARWLALGWVLTCAPRTLAADAGEARPVSGGDEPGEGFLVKTPDDNYKLRIRLQAAYRFEPKFLNGQSQDRTAILSARPALAGSLVRPWITFLTSVELSGNPPYLYDSWLDVRPVSEFGVRVGQQETPFSRHENFGLYRIIFPETGPVSGYFWSGRDKGLTA